MVDGHDSADMADVRLQAIKGCVMGVSDSIVEVVCVNCGQVNRVPTDRPANKATCGRCGAILFGREPVQIDDAGLTKQIERSDFPLVIDFWAEWCGPCRAMAPAYAQAAVRLATKAHFLKVEVDSNPMWAGKLGVRGIPALFVIHRGKVVAQRSGALDSSSIEKWVRSSLDVS